VTTVATGGLNLIPGVKKVIAPVTNVIEKVVAPALVPTSLKGILAPVVAVATKNPAALLPAAMPAIPANSGGPQPMGINLGGVLQTVSSGLGGFQNPFVQAVSAGTNIASQFFPQPSAMPVVNTFPMAQPVAARAPSVPMVATGTAVARSFFNRFPNLAVAMQQLKNRGLRVKRSQLFSLLKRFGPEVLITGGLLTAAAVNELMVAGAGRRRMNPANVKALRRSMRRLESFHHLCVRVDRLRAPRRRHRAAK